LPPLEARRVDGDEGAGGAVAHGVEGARGQALARPALALDQHRTVALARLREAPEELLHGRRAAEEPAQPGRLPAHALPTGGSGREGSPTAGEGARGTRAVALENLVSSRR